MTLWDLGLATFVVLTVALSFIVIRFHRRAQRFAERLRAATGEERERLELELKSKPLVRAWIEEHSHWSLIPSGVIFFVLVVAYYSWK